jgi:hypothetical protein
MLGAPETTYKASQSQELCPALVEIWDCPLCVQGQVTPAAIFLLGPRIQGLKSGIFVWTLDTILEV